VKFQNSGGTETPMPPSDAHDCYVTFRPQFTTSKCCAWGQICPLPPWLRHSSRHNHMFASRYAYSQIYWSRTKLHKLSYWHILQNKNRLRMQQNVEPSAIFFQAFNSAIRTSTGSRSQCSEAPTALSLSLILSFYRTNVEPIDQVKSNLSVSVS